ncbi:hypothetical protein BDR03DRAFT_980511 [Suillus americanus]|nr:hypothetical protein BDR03DRAFT_980511 [Suillus americanus]
MLPPGCQSRPLLWSLNYYADETDPTSSSEKSRFRAQRLKITTLDRRKLLAHLDPPVLTTQQPRAPYHHGERHFPLLLRYLLLPLVCHVSNRRRPEGWDQGHYFFFHYAYHNNDHYSIKT